MITCFVASAFEHKDVDAIYDRIIKPTLRQLGIRCVRADRVEHNDDIDDKIFALMNGADFCIADLTYARPSVYYEAGYMFGCKKPVVYVARRDHLSPTLADQHGNLRVHFDLQMKNIISWDTPSDAFALKLRRRIRNVIAPALKAQAARQELAQQETAFTGEAISTQLALLKRFGGEIFKASGFSEPSETTNEVWRPPSRLISVERKKRKVYQTINFIPVERLSKSQIPPYWGWPLQTVPDGVKVLRIQHLLVYATLKNTTESLFRSVFPRFRPVAPFVLEKRDDPIPLIGAVIGAVNRPELPTIRTIGLLPAIRSVRQFREGLLALLKSLDFD